MGMRLLGLTILVVGVAFSRSEQKATRELPRAIAGDSYEAALTPIMSLRCPFREVTWSVAEGSSLPEGLALDATGLRGIPTRAGSYEFTLHESTDCGAIDVPARLVVAGKPVLSLSRGVLEYNVEAGGQTDPQSFLVSADQDRIAYSLSVAGAEWLQFSSAAGKTGERGSGDAVSVRVNAAALAPGAYEAVLRVTSWRGANAPSVKVKLNVAPPDLGTPGHSDLSAQ